MGCPTTTRLRVLVVDDSADYRAAVSRLIATYPQVETAAEAASASEALSRMGLASPDLLLIDVAMPEVNGLELTRAIKALPQPPKVIIVTLYDTPTYREAARAAGADGFLGKSQLGDDLPGLMARLFPQSLG